MPSTISLRAVTDADLPIFYEQQLDPDATRMAAFPSRERTAFMAHWANKVLVNPTGMVRTIVWAGQVAGNVVSWEQEGDQLVGYWLGKAYWGKGIATTALQLFLHAVTVRPLYAHVAKHNVGSIRVLEKCGFIRNGEALAILDDASEPIIEVLLKLEA